MHLHFASKASAIIRSSETFHCFHSKHKRLPICPRNLNLHLNSNLNSISNLTGSCTRTAITRRRSVSSNSVLSYLNSSTNLNSKSDIPTKSTSLSLNLSSPDLNSRTIRLSSKALRNPNHCTRTFSTRLRAGVSFAMAKAGKMTDGELVEAALKRLWDDDNSITASQSTIDIGINLADPSYDKVSMTLWCISNFVYCKIHQELWGYIAAYSYGHLWRHWEKSHLFQTFSDFVQNNKLSLIQTGDLTVSLSEIVFGSAQWKQFSLLRSLQIFCLVGRASSTIQLGCLEYCKVGVKQKY